MRMAVHNFMCFHSPDLLEMPYFMLVISQMSQRIWCLNIWTLRESWNFNQRNIRRMYTNLIMGIGSSTALYLKKKKKYCAGSGIKDKNMVITIYKALYSASLLILILIQTRVGIFSVAGPAAIVTLFDRSSSWEITQQTYSDLLDMSELKRNSPEGVAWHSVGERRLVGAMPGSNPGSDASEGCEIGIAFPSFPICRMKRIITANSHSCCEESVGHCRQGA